MKTLILYASKYGSAEAIAKSIAEKIGKADIYNLNQESVPSLKEYDCVIIGSSIYAGAIRKEAKAYITSNVGTLGGKILGLFVCGLDGGKDTEYFQTNFPKELIDKAKAKMFLGGVFDPKKASLFEKLAIWIISKQSGRVDKTDEGKVDEFVKAMTA